MAEKRKRAEPRVQFYERSVYSDRYCFASTCHDNGVFTDVECMWGGFLLGFLSPHSFFFVGCLRFSLQGAPTAIGIRGFWSAFPIFAWTVLFTCAQSQKLALNDCIDEVDFFFFLFRCCLCLSCFFFCFLNKVKMRQKKCGDEQTEATFAYLL